MVTAVLLPPVPAIRAQETEVSIEIPSQPLGEALKQLSRQTSLQLFYTPELVAGKNAPAVRGKMPPRQALDALLKGSGLEYRRSGTSITLQQSTPIPAHEPKTQQEPAITLPQVTVQDTREAYAVTQATNATKIDAPIMDIPQSIQVVPRQVIDDQRAVNLSDVLRNVSGFSPSVNSQSQRFGERNAIFRGFTVNNYYTNGYKDPFNGTSFTFGLANIDRVEVLKGPSSVLYGLGEPGATINIITKQPLSDWYASGALTGARFGLVNPSVDVSGPLTSGKELRFRFNAGYQYQDSFVDFVKSQRFIVAPVLSWSIGPNTLLTAEGEYQELGEIYYTGLPARGTIERNVNGKIPLSRYLGDKKLEGDDFPERSQGKVGYRLEHRFNEHVSLRHGFRTTLFNINERDIIPGSLGADQRTFSRFLFDATSSWQQYYFLTDFAFDFKTGPLAHKLLVGSDQRFGSNRDRWAFVSIPSIDVFNPTYGNLTDPVGPGTPRSLFSSSGTFIGAYFQDLITIIDPLKLLVGGRYDNAKQKTKFGSTAGGTPVRSEFDDSVFTPRVGLVFQPIPSVAIYTSYTESFNPIAGTTFAGSAFKPETGVQYEGGLKFDLFGGRIISTLAGYQLTRKNVRTPDPVHPGFSIQVGEQRSRGFEFDISGEVLPSFRLIATYAFTNAEIIRSNSGTQGNRPANVPEHTGSLWGIYKFQENVFKGFSLGLGVIGVGKRPADDANSATLPAYARTDALIQYRLSKNLDFALNFKNLFDVRYFESSTFSSANNGISPGAPFTAFGTVTLRY